MFVAHTISLLILVRKVDASPLLVFRQNKGAGYVQWTMLDVPTYIQKMDSQIWKR
jgi:hypothetical protein